jgi:peptidoglycan/xylan/chitin deacetylase (PgdA/CDA1 family)
MNILKKLFYSLPAVKVMMIHHVAPQADERCPCVINAENLKSFLNHYRIIKVADALRCRGGNHNGSAVITVDDALADLYTELYPICKAGNFPFTAFISSDMLDKEGYITTAQLIEMSGDPLVTIGSHGATHALLNASLTNEQLMFELAHSKKKLESVTEKRIDLLAYSNGVFDSRTIKFARKAGYQYAFGVRPRPLNRATRLLRHRLPRYNITNDTYKNIAKH